MSPHDPTPPALGVGALLSETVSLYFQRVHWFAALAFVPLVLTGLIMVFLFGAGALTGDFQFEASGDAGWSPGWVAVAIGMPLYTVTGAVTTALVTLAAYDAKSGQPVRLGFYVATVMRHVVPVLVCSLVAAVLIYAGLFLFVLPGILLLGVFFIIVPVIVIEGGGFGSIARGIRLGKGYRWPIVGYVLVLAACAAVINGVTGAIVGPLLDLVGAFPGAIVSAIVTAVTTSFFYLGPALVHARLIEIKEAGQSNPAP